MTDFRATSKGSENTVEAYQGDLEDFERFLGQRGASLSGSPSEHDVLDYFSEQEQKGLGGATRRRRYAALHAFAKYRGDEGIELARILREMGRPALKRRPPQSLSSEQIELMIAAIKPSSMLYLRDVAILRLLDSGLRANELCDLKTSDVVLQANSVRVAGDGRIVPHGKEANDALRTYISDCRPKLLKSPRPLLFLSRTGKRLNRTPLWMLVKKYGRKAGVDAAPSILRHSCATRHLREGVAPAFVQQILGHSRVDITKTIYSKVTAAGGEAAAAVPPGIIQNG